MGTTSEGGDRPWQSYHTVYTNAKAGMDGVDKEKVQRIVYEMSKGSKYFENEQRKEAFIQQKMENMRGQYAKLTLADISHFQTIADRRILELEATRVLSKIWLHVDMDAFYAAVETLECPSLKGKPLAVGNMSMLCTANYEARRFGVRAAMPGFIACKLCPDLTFVPPNFKKYTYYSELTRKVFHKYDPCFITTSLDEGYLDITEACREKGMSGGEIAEELRGAVYTDTGLTCSAGVAPNRLLAKVCSDINKPNGQFVLPNDRMAVMTFISSLPIRKIGGIGKVTEHVLRDVLGINTCEEMLQKSAFLCALFSHSSAEFFLSVGLGLGRTDNPQSKLRKSMSTERTFPSTEDEALLFQRLADIAETLSNDMQKEGLCGRTLTLKLKTASFEVRTRAVSLQKYIYSSKDILSHASKLLKAELPLSVRLIGLRMSQFNDDKFGQADPMQRTLTNFVISGDMSLKVTNGSFQDSEINDNQLMHVNESSLSNDGQDIYLLGAVGPSDTDHLSDIEDKCHTFGNDASETQKSCGPVEVEYPAKEMNDLQTMKAEDLSSCRQFEANNLGEMYDKANPSDNNVAVSSSREENSFWIDDYRCSLCGFELPPDFVEERQDHSDYHFAEVLQKEESTHNSRVLMQKQRFDQKAQHAKESARKKRKPSPKDSKHLTIDLFFNKDQKSFCYKALIATSELLFPSPLVNLYGSHYFPPMRMGRWKIHRRERDQDDGGSKG
ncbi:DNA/RNA polymerases superfamily protein [Tasmannia lanceolata]|uniref:DNA/RNA polymerases superfamily protein n=1 Tax=Tasmannia lanceolata TaxID=3420 RepID=UPI00406490E8